MEVSVKYSDFSTTIKEVEIPFTDASKSVPCSHKFEFVTVTEEVGGTIEVPIFDTTEKVKFTTSVEELDFVEIDMDKEELRDYIEVLRKIIVQMK